MAKKDEIEDVVEVEEEVTQDEPEVEIVDDVPPEEKPRLKADTASDGTDGADDTDDDDLEGYSEKVKKRLNKLTFKYREAERKEQEASRLREEAIKYAKQVNDENKLLRQSVEQGQGAYVEQAKARATAELDRAKREFKEAYEAGESDALTDAQAALAKAQNDLYRLENYRPQPVQTDVHDRDWDAPQRPQRPQQPQQQLTALQQEWMEQNPWFMKNKAMTGYAYGVHEELVESGVDPNSRTYYDRIDKAMRQRFADEFEGSGEDVDDVDDVVEVEPKPKKKPANVVASAQRSTKQPRKIRLTATQASLARRLGVSPEAYAAQMLKEAKNG